jgi:CO/xanthine dehydrogenase Mo-binding subunit
VLAAVAAVDAHTARAAAALVDVEYEVLPPVTLDPRRRWRRARPRSTRRYGNVLSHTKIRRGDVDAALAASAHVVTGTWTTQRIEHLFLEPESALAEPGAPRHVQALQPGPGRLRRSPAVRAFLGISEDDLAVELVPNGGAFGGKEDMSVQAQTALLAS